MVKNKQERNNKKELDEAKAYYKGSFTRNFTSTVSIANLLNIVQFYELGNDYFSQRDKIIENLKLEDINNMIKKILIVIIYSF